MIRQRMRGAAALVVALLVGLGLAACAGDDEGQGAEESFSQVLEGATMPDFEGVTHLDAVQGSANTCRYLSVCLVIANGSEDAAPNDVTFDAHVAGVQQQLSLITGEATTDLTYYPAVHAEYEPVWWEFEGDPELGEETVGCQSIPSSFRSR